MQMLSMIIAKEVNVSELKSSNCNIGAKISNHVIMIVEVLTWPCALFFFSVFTVINARLFTLNILFDYFALTLLLFLILIFIGMLKVYLPL